MKVGERSRCTANIKEIQFPLIESLLKGKHQTTHKGSRRTFKNLINFGAITCFPVPDSFINANRYSFRNNCTHEKKKIIS